MSLDLRTPMGLMFTIVGAILFVYGLVTHGSAIYARSAGLDINLIWGLVMLAFGLTMLFMGRYSDTHPKKSAPQPDDRPRMPGH